MCVDVLNVMYCDVLLMWNKCVHNNVELMYNVPDVCCISSKCDIAKCNAILMRMQPDVCKCELI